MKKTYFCVMSETYENGAVKAAITTRYCKVKPIDQYRKLPFMTARMDWFESRESAEAHLAGRAAA